MSYIGIFDIDIGRKPWKIKKRLSFRSVFTNF